MSLAGLRAAKPARLALIRAGVRPTTTVASSSSTTTMIAQKAVPLSPPTAAPRAEHDHEAVSLSFLDLEYEEPSGSVGFRLFYPTDGPSVDVGGGATSPAAPPPFSSPRWGDGVAGREYAAGYAAFAFHGAPPSLKLRLMKAGLTAALWLLSATWRLPLSRARPLAAAAAADGGSGSGGGGGDGGGGGGRAPARLPVVVFSHGAASNRHTYTYLAREIARRVPCAVACVEHSDGSAGAARVTGGRGEWLYFSGLGMGAALERKNGVRVGEVALAARALRALDRGGGGAFAGDAAAASAGGGGEGGKGGGGEGEGGGKGGGEGEGGGGRLWRLEAGKQQEGGAAGDPVLASFRGRLDLAKLAVAGHSCGGATAAAAAHAPPPLLDAAVSAVVAFDPWWPLLQSDLPPLAPAFADPGAAASRRPPAPLLVVGSLAWNTPRADGRLSCDGERQRRVFETWKRPAAGAGGGAAAAGALLVVPRGSAHHSFSDVALLLEGSRALRKLRGLTGAPAPELGSAEAIELSGWAAARFLRQRWEEGGGGEGGVGPRPVRAEELEAYRAHFGDRAAILEAHVAG